MALSILFFALFPLVVSCISLLIVVLVGILLEDGDTIGFGHNGK
jgi:hypothetical protein